jgi:hypothetical protein
VAVADDDSREWQSEAEAETAPEPVAEAEDDQVVDEDLPQWLNEAATLPGFEPALAASSTGRDDDQNNSMVEEEDLPEWLRDIQEEKAVSAPVAESATPAPVDPSMLEDVSDGLIETDDLPDWLKESEDDIDVGLGSDDLGIDREGLPGWLQDVEAADERLFGEDSDIDDMVAEEDLPDWLSDVQVGVSDPFEPSEPSPLGAEELGEEDLPDWLKEAHDEGSDFGFDVDDSSTLLTELNIEEDKSVKEEGLPDWLQDVELEAALAIPEPSVFEPAPIPVVLGETEEIVKEEPVPEVPATPTEVSSDTTVGIPDWLQKLREGDKGEETLRAEVSPTLTPIPQPARPPLPVAEAPAAPELEKRGDELPVDVDEQLLSAQTARDKGDIGESMRIYDSLITSGTYLDKIIEDMQQAIKSQPSNPWLYQVMGDAMLKDGRLKNALEAYRQALEKLSR